MMGKKRFKKFKHHKSNVPRPTLIFDEESRIEYLTGMRKRKQKRKEEGTRLKEIADRQKRLKHRQEIRNVRKELNQNTSIMEHNNIGKDEQHCNGDTSGEEKDQPGANAEFNYDSLGSMITVTTM